MGLFGATRGQIEISVLSATRDNTVREETHVEEEKKKGVEEAARVDSRAVKTCLAAEMI